MTQETLVTTRMRVEGMDCASCAIRADALEAENIPASRTPARIRVVLIRRRLRLRDTARVAPS